MVDGIGIGGGRRGKGEGGRRRRRKEEERTLGHEAGGEFEVGDRDPGEYGHEDEEVDLRGRGG